MHAPVDVGIVVTIVIFNRIDHRQRLLRGSGVIQVNQRFAVHFLVQYRKLPAYLLNVKPTRRLDLARRLDYGTHPTSSKFRSVTSTRAPVYRARSGRPSTTRRSR